MAISSDLPGLTISIRVGDRKLPEYRDADIEDPPRVISYMIEAIPDTIFSINAHAGPDASFRGSSLALYFYVDGKYVDGALIDSSEMTHGQGAGARSQGRYVRDNMLRRYQFASRERQIELVEMVSTSLSSRPRKSAQSSATPNVSYAGRPSASMASADRYALSAQSGMPSMRSESYTSATSHLPDNANPRVARAPGRFSTALPRRQAYHSTTITDQAYHSIDIQERARSPARGLDLPRRPAVVDYDTGPSLSDEEPATTTYVPRAAAYPPRQSTINMGRTPHSGSMTLPRMLGIAATSHSEFNLSQPEPAAAPPDQPSVALSATKDAESATVGSDFTAPEELGTIKIIVTHVNKKGAVAFGRNASTTAQIGDKVQEAVKDKSGGLLVRFTAPQTVSPITTWDVGAVNEDDDGDTSVTYLYHYQMLDALGVLPDMSDTKLSEMSEMDGSWQKLSAFNGAGRQGGPKIKEEGSCPQRSSTKEGVLGDEEWEMICEDDA